MKKYATLIGVSAVLAGQGIGAAHAEQQWGAFKATPRINLSVTTTNNLYSTKSNEKSTGITVINPGLNLKAGNKVFNYYMDLDFAIGKHSSTSDDNYEDSTLSGGAVYQPTSRAKFSANAEVAHGHDARGTGRTEGNAATTTQKPDEYEQRTIDGEFSYGVAGAKGNLILSADHVDKRYTNNRPGTKELDHDESGVGAVFKWRVAPKTQLLFEFRNRDFDYDFTAAGNVSKDSDEQRYFVGVEWQATYKTKGSARIGRLHKDFDSSTRKDLSDGAWEVAVEWKPRSYSKVDISTGRTTAESSGAAIAATGNVTVSDYYKADWTHTWIKRLATTVGYAYTEVDYPGTTSARKDETDVFKASVDYKMRRWLDLSAGFERTVTDSSDSSSQYSRNDLFIKAAASF